MYLVNLDNLHYNFFFMEQEEYWKALGTEQLYFVLFCFINMFKEKTGSNFKDLISITFSIITKS